MKRFVPILGIFMMSSVVVIMFIQSLAWSRTVAAIEKLQPEQVDHLLVFDGTSPIGASREVSDSEKIEALVACLKSGSGYTADHDHQNGFERVIFLEPSLLQIGVYQKIGDNDSMIIRLGKWTKETAYFHYGYLRCPADPVWREL